MAKYKNLKDYTLGDLQVVCRNIEQNCNKCMFRSIGCQMSYPAYFDLTDKIVFSPKEVELAKGLVACFSEEANIKKYSANSPLRLCWNEYIVKMNADSFPTLKEFDTCDIELKDIIKKGAVKID